MDEWTLLRLHLDWGADEALADHPIDRLAAPANPRPAPTIVAAPADALAKAGSLAAAAHSMDDLRSALAGLEECALQATAAHLVFAEGPPAAALMVIGEAPGEDEDRSGRPFCGSGGRLFERMLGSIGLDRRQLVLTYVIPWRPPGNRKPNEAEVQLCLPFLLRLIGLAEPHRLLLLGGLPARLLLPNFPRAGLKAVRGAWQDVQLAGLLRTIPALPMFHPDHLLAHPIAKRDAWADLLALRKTLDGAP